jgi:hypothetical protein
LGAASLSHDGRCQKQSGSDNEKAFHGKLPNQRPDAHKERASGHLEESVILVLLLASVHAATLAVFTRFVICIVEASAS